MLCQSLSSMLRNLMTGGMEEQSLKGVRIDENSGVSTFYGRTLRKKLRICSAHNENVSESRDVDAVRTNSVNDKFNPLQIA